MLTARKQAGTQTTAPHRQPEQAAGRIEIPTVPGTSGASQNREPTAETLSAAPVLITEQAVMFATAAAVQPRPTVQPGPTLMRRWIHATVALLAAVNRVGATSSRDVGPAGRYYPKRYSYLENACMGRAMERL